MRKKLRFVNVLGSLAICLAVSGAYSTTVQADPLVFSNVTAYQNGGLNSYDLLSNSGMILLGPQVTFSVDISGTLPAGGTDLLQITFTEAGMAPVIQNFQIPLFGGTQPPFTLLFSFNAQNATYAGTFSTLTLNLLGSSPDFVMPGGQAVDSFTYTFMVSQPVPEPTTIALLGLGLGGLVIRARRRRSGG